MRSFRERRAWLVGALSIALIAAAVGLAFSVNRFEGLRGVYPISAHLQDAAGLQKGNEVRVAGVKVGTVTGVQLTDRSARVDMEIQDNVRIPSESRLEVKLKTLLGQKFIELQLPRSFVRAAAEGRDAAQVVDGFLQAGDAIPISHTRVPFEIYEAANEGTEVLEEIDKRGLRDLLNVLADSAGTAKGELGRALRALDRAGAVLADKGGKITSVLRSAEDVTGILARSESDIGGSLSRSAEVLGVLADRRATVSSLLAATNDLANNLAILIRTVRGDIHLGVQDLNGILILAESELDTIEVALDELGLAQKMFAQPLTFGRFVEGHVCAITTEDTCVTGGSPEIPGIPVKGQQPSPTPAPQGGIR